MTIESATYISDLNTANPGATDIIPEGDDHLRLIKTVLKNTLTTDGSGNVSTTKNISGAAITGTSTVTGSALIPSSATVPTNGLYLKAANNPALASNTTLRWDVNSTGNHVFAAPSSGTAVTINALAGTNSLVLTGALNGSAVQANITNTSNTASSTAVQVISCAGTTALSAHTLYDVTGIIDWYVGVKGSTSTWSVGTGQVVGAADKLSISTSGNVTFAGAAGSDTAIINGGTSGSFRVNTTGVPYATSAHNNAGAVTGATNQYFCSGTYTPTLTNTTNVAASTSRLANWKRVGNEVTVSGQVDITPTAANVDTLLGMSLPIASALTTAFQLGGTANIKPSGNTVGIPGVVDGDAANDRASLQFCNGAATVSRTWVYEYTYEVL